MSRGVLYVVWGNQHDRLLERSIASIKAVHRKLSVHVRRLPESASFLDKAKMMDFSPFDETLYLDADTVVLDSVDFGFSMARQHGLACCICECPWASRYAGIEGDTVEYNTGVLFFTRKAKPIFEDWKRLAPKIDSTIIHMHPDGRKARMPCNDQASFAAAVSRAATLPFVLPLNWNFRPYWQKSWFGKLKIWHDRRDPPSSLLHWNEKQRRWDAIIQHCELK